MLSQIKIIAWNKRFLYLQQRSLNLMVSCRRNFIKICSVGLRTLSLMCAITAVVIFVIAKGYSVKRDNFRTQHQKILPVAIA